ncbi:Shedu immune nuclease family protein [Lactiplantibacillus plantarum]|uniref:Shedu immune nuclease family protein n=1 Tax=Lactiplantibacillus plantarum TaxID=1590 RepID=UPI0010765F1F|nr:Shedu immune nuclease family protein [Lactiplantibacillus plantarum]TFZ22322.1 DUF4263 domain-containing protein [Lactiplantibacillus plantarum]TFZ24293.1 DUF4263 domain-containing protein [Lactiplantibacillus plantarum]
MTNYDFVCIGKFICIQQDKTWVPSSQNLRILMNVNPQNIGYSTNILEEKIFPQNRRIGKLMYLFDQKSIFHMWQTMSDDEKEQLYEKNVADISDEAYKWNLSDLLSMKNNKQIQLGDRWIYPVGKLMTVTQNSKEEEYYQFTAAPLENGGSKGYLYLSPDARFGLNPTRIFIKNDVNKSLPNMWQTMYKLWDYENQKPGFFLGGSLEPNFELADIKDIRNKLVTKSELNLYADVQNRKIIEKYVDTINNVKEERLRNKQRKREKNISLVTTENKDALTHVNSFLENKRDILKKYLNTSTQDARPKWNEHSYQRLLLEIFPFIFPQYTHFIREYNFKIEGNSQKKEDIPDFLAATANLSVDILEIKTPYFDLFRKGKYRGNFVFSSEVQGLISQAQKYIYNLERNALREEPKITKKFQKETDFKGEHLYIRSPKAIVIVGKNPQGNLATEQLRDFEIFKRKYQDITTFLTYSDILARINRIINRQRKSIP